MNAQKRRAIFERFRAANPHPTTELEYHTPFELLVAVILSAQATDKSVNAVTRKLFPVARTPQAIAELGVEGLAKYIRTIGLWKAKAKNVVATASTIVKEHGGEVPRTREALENLPGVGRKTANVVLNTIFGEPTIAVDTHIFRVANRTKLAPGKTPRKLVGRLSEDVGRAIDMADVKERIAALGALAKRSTPEAFDKLVHEEIVTRTKVWKAAGVKIE